MAKKRYNRSERRVIESAQMNLHAIFKHIRTFDNPPLMWNAVLLCCSTSQVQQRQLTIFASNKQCGRRHPAKKSKSQLTSYVRYGKNHHGDAMFFPSCLLLRLLILQARAKPGRSDTTWQLSTRATFLALYGSNRCTE